MWWRLRSKHAAKSETQRPRPEALANAERDQTLDILLDTLAAVVRLLGQHAFDTKDRDAAWFEQHCEHWVNHILLGTERPDGGAGADSETRLASERRRAIPLVKRDWRGLYLSLQNQRLAEEQAVAMTIGTLRNLMIDSLGSFRQLIDEDRKLANEVAYRLEQLKLAAESQPLEVLRGQILATVECISSAVREKNRAIDQQMEQMRRQIGSARAEILDLRREMEEDPLTGTHNRRALDKALAKLSDYAAFVDEDLVLMIVDVDHLKTINDTHGHQAGDALLSAAGQTLIKAFPRKDDFVARYGGDEFVVLLGQTDRETALRLARRCVEQFRELRIDWKGQVLPCSVSIGVANYDRKESIEACLSRADAALYEAKQAGRDTCMCH